MEANTRSSRVSAGGGAGTRGYGARTSEEVLVLIGQREERTGTSRSVSASASDRVWTTPPRGWVE